MTNPMNGQVPESLVDDYIKNHQKAKEAKEKNDALKPVIIRLLETDQTHLLGKDTEYYLSVSNRSVWSNYTNPRVAELEKQIDDLKDKLSTLKKVEQLKGNASLEGGHRVLTVRPMTKSMEEKLHATPPSKVEINSPEETYEL